MTNALTGVGTVVNVAGGQTYSESVSVPQQASGVEGAPTAIRPWPDRGRPVIDAAGAEVGISICCGDGAPEHVSLEGLEVTGALAHGILVAGGGADFVTIRDCLVHGNGAGPALDSSGSGITVDFGADSARIENNEVFENTSTDGMRRVRGIVVDASVGTEVIENFVHDNRPNGIRVEGGQAVIASDNVVVADGPRRRQELR